MYEDNYIEALELKISDQELEIEELYRQIDLLESNLDSAYAEIASLREQYC